MRLGWSVVLLVVVSACGDDDDAGLDGAVDAALADSGDQPGFDAASSIDALVPARPAPVVPPTLAVMTPCPAGWRTIPASGDDVATCDPWPAGGRATCAALDEAHFPGEPACVRVGTSCPVGDFPTGLPAGASVIYVRGGAPGSGSIASPYNSITRALAQAATGDIVAIAKGTYAETIVVPAGVTLWGACALSTVIAPTGGGGMHAVATGGPGVVMRNLRVGGSKIGGFSAAAHSLVLIDVVVAGAVGLGVWADGALDATNLVVRDTVGVSMDAPGIGLRAGGQASVTRAVFSRNRGVGMQVRVGTATLRDVAASDTEPWNMDGVGLEVRSGASVVAQRIAIDGNFGIAVAVFQAMGSRLSALEISDAVISGTRRSPMGQGIGIACDSSDPVSEAELTASRVLVKGGHRAGIGIYDGGKSTLSNVVIRELNVSEIDTNNAGLRSVGATLDARAVMIQRGFGNGIHLSKGRAMVEDLVVEDLVATASSPSATGIVVGMGADLQVSRALIRRNRGHGLIAYAATIRATDLAIEDHEGPLDDQLGGGIGMMRFGQLTVTRARIRGSRGVGILAGEGSSVVAEDLEVADTRAMRCGLACPMYGGWTAGIAVYFGGRVNAVRFHLHDNLMIGLQIAPTSGTSGGIDLSLGVVEGHEVGANIQYPGFDIARLGDRVLFRNIRNFDTDALPLPPAAGPLP